MHDSPDPQPPVPWWESNTLLLLAGVVWGVLRIAHGEVGDDAFITFVHARNLAEGHGFVFNPGEMVLGSTAPLFGLFVAAGCLLGIPPWHWVAGWDVVLGFVILWRVRQLMRIGGAAEWFPTAAALILAASPQTLPVGGMETGWYAAVILGALVAVASRAPAVVAISWGTAAMLIRPDGVFVLAVAGCFLLVRTMRENPDAGAVSALVRLAPSCLPILAIPVMYGCLYMVYGDWLPHSVRAKSLTVGPAPLQTLIAFAYPQEHFWLYGRPNVVGVLSLIGLLLALRGPLLRVVGVFYLVYFAGFAVARAPMGFFWYRVPLYQLMYVFAALGAGFVLVHAVSLLRLGSRVRHASMPDICLATTLVLFIPQLHVFTVLNRYNLESLSADTRYKNYERCARYLNENVPVDSVVACYEVGALRYFLRDRSVFDLAGLVTPQILEQYTIDPEFDRLQFSRADYFVHAYWNFEPPSTRQAIEADIATHGYYQVKEYPWDTGHGVTAIYRRWDANGT